MTSQHREEDKLPERFKLIIDMEHMPVYGDMNEGDVVCDECGKFGATYFAYQSYSLCERCAKEQFEEAGIKK